MQRLWPKGGHRDWCTLQLHSHHLDVDKERCARFVVKQERKCMSEVGPRLCKGWKVILYASKVTRRSMRW